MSVCVCVCVDSVLACASGSGAVQMIDKSSEKVTSTHTCIHTQTHIVLYSAQVSHLEGGSDSIETLVYSHSADMLYTGSTNGTLAIWQ